MLILSLYNGLYVCLCFFMLTDIIDENMKIALQKDLNAMAPGLSIQVKITIAYM